MEEAPPAYGDVVTMFKCRRADCNWIGHDLIFHVMNHPNTIFLKQLIPSVRTGVLPFSAQFNQRKEHIGALRKGYCIAVADTPYTFKFDVLMSYGDNGMTIDVVDFDNNNSLQSTHRVRAHTKCKFYIDTNIIAAFESKCHLHPYAVAVPFTLLTLDGTQMRAIFKELLNSAPGVPADHVFNNFINLSIKFTVPL